MARIGVDAGTSLVKAVLFDDAWRAVATAATGVPVQRPHPGWAEQRPQDVWGALVEVVTAVLREDDGASGPVEVVAVTAQGDGCWLVDADGAPARPAMLWNDGRAGAVVDRWDADGLLQRAFERTGSWGFAGLATAQLAWLGEHEPDVLAGAATLLSCGSWLDARLTGRRVLDVSEASNPFLAADGSGYDLALLHDLGLGAVERLLPDVVRQGSRAAPLCPQAAATLGLPAGTPVVLAPYDVVTTLVGLGAVGPDDAMAVLGTTLAVGVAARDAGLDRPPTGCALDLGLDGRWMLLYGTLAGTEVVEWARRLLGLDHAGDVLALAAQAATDPQRPRPLVLPYLSPAGERTPFRDPLARGAVVGLDVEHTRADLARAVVDGLDLAVRECLEASRRRPATLHLSGGGARSDLWCQSLADACGLPVVRGGTGEVGALGAVLVAAAETGAAASVAAAVRAAVTPGTAFEPDGRTSARYAEQAARLVAARAAGVHRA